MTKYELLTSGKSLKDLTVDELMNLQKDKSLLALEHHAVTNEVVLRMTVGNVGVTAQTGHIVPIKPLAWVEGFKAACDLLKADANGDRYGIGSMCSQWRADEVADDLIARIMEAFNVRT